MLATDAGQEVAGRALPQAGLRTASPAPGCCRSARAGCCERDRSLRSCDVRLSPPRPPGRAVTATAACKSDHDRYRTGATPTMITPVWRRLGSRRRSIRGRPPGPVLPTVELPHVTAGAADAASHTRPDSPCGSRGRRACPAAATAPQCRPAAGPGPAASLRMNVHHGGCTSADWQRSACSSVAGAAHGGPVARGSPRAAGKSGPGRALIALTHTTDT